MNAAELKRAKRVVRAEVRAIRDAISPAERRRLSAEITDRFLDLEEVRAAARLMAFWSFGSEVETGDLISDLHGRGAEVALPRIVGEDLGVFAYAPGDAVAFAPFGAGEPIDGEAIDPAALDVVLIPGVAFDREGRRIGYGGGYYDRFLRGPNVRGFRVAVAFAAQVLDRPLPAGSFDLPVEAIVTERETIRRASARPST